MFRLSYSELENRISIHIIGRLEDNELPSYTEEMLRLVGMAKPGFTVCADLTECMDTSFMENEKNFVKVRNYGVEKGLRCAVYILGEDNFERHQQTPIRGVRYAFRNRAEAERFLNM